jgi:hypothetical protein
MKRILKHLTIGSVYKLDITPARGVLTPAEEILLLQLDSIISQNLIFYIVATNVKRFRVTLNKYWIDVDSDWVDKLVYIPFSDLPLYMYMKYKTPRFKGLIRG